MSEDANDALICEDKENKPSSSQDARSRLHSEKSKSVSAGRNRKAQARLKDDLSFSSLSQTSRERKGEAHSLSKMLGKQYFMDAERYLKLLSPGGAPARDNPRSRHELDARLLHESRHDSPHLKTLKSSGDDKKSSKMHPASLGDLTSNSKAVRRANHASSTDKPVKKMVTQELVKRYMEETQRKTEKEVVQKKEKFSQHEFTSTQTRTKKKRPKSCYSKIGDGVFSAREPQAMRDRSLESANKTCLLTDAIQGHVGSRPSREKPSYITELNCLNRAVNDEIKRDKIASPPPRNVFTPAATK